MNKNADEVLSSSEHSVRKGISVGMGVLVGAIAYFTPIGDFTTDIMNSIFNTKPRVQEVSESNELVYVEPTIQKPTEGPTLEATLEPKLEPTEEIQPLDESVYRSIDIMLTNGHIKGVMTMDIELSSGTNLYLGNGAAYGPFDRHVDHIYLTRGEGENYSEVALTRDKNYDDFSALFDDLDKLMAVLLYTNPESYENLSKVTCIEGTLPEGLEYVFCRTEGVCPEDSLTIPFFNYAVFTDGAGTCSVDGKIDQITIYEDGDNVVIDTSDSVFENTHAEGTKYMDSARSEFVQKADELISEMNLNYTVAEIALDHYIENLESGSD